MNQGSPPHHSDPNHTPFDRALSRRAGQSNNNESTNRESNGHFSPYDERSQQTIDKLLTVLLQEEGAPAPQHARGFDLSHYLEIARRRVWPLCLIFLVTAVAMAWLLRPGKPTYVTSATLLLPTDTTSPAASAAEAGAGGRSAMDNDTQTQIAILTSPPLIRRAYLKLPEKMRAEGWRGPDEAAATVQATTPNSKRIVEISVRAQQPEAAIALSNALIEAYQQRTRELAAQFTSQNMKDVTRQVEEAREMYLKAKEELQDFQQKSGVVDLSARITSSNERIDQLEQKLQEAQIEADAGASSQAVQTDPVVATLQERVSEARLRKQTVDRDFLPNAPEARQATADLNNAQEALDRRVSSLTRAAREQASNARGLLQQAQNDASTLPAISARSNELTTKVELLKATYTNLQNRSTSLDLNNNNQVMTATVLTPAEKVSALNTTWARAITVACLCALVLAALAVTLIEQMDRTVHSVPDLEELAQAPVLGTMPLLKQSLERRLAFLDGGRPTASPLLEACRILRSNLLFTSLDSTLRSVLITSSEPGEGKSLTALNLATAMAYSGKHVILVDLDLRRPTQHRLNEIDLKPGFTDVLTNAVETRDALHNTTVNNLQVMTAGTLPPNPPELLSGQTSHQLLETLKGFCDIVVVDSPPLSLTDSQILSTMVDGVLLVVAADATTKNHLERSQQMLQRAGARLLGVVFNKVQAKNDPYHYYSYYRYYGNDGEATPKALPRARPEKV